MANYDIGFDGPIAGGITPGEDFLHQFERPGKAVDGSGGWGANNTFTAVANLPEPATWPLLASGIALLAGLPPPCGAFTYGAEIFLESH